MTIRFIPSFHLTLGLILSLGIAFPAIAAPGHDHGDESTGNAVATASPRFAAETELFDLVGVLSGKQITVYLDRASDNSPVEEAKLELQIAGKPVPLEKQSVGTFVATLEAPLAAGVHPITATIVAGSDSDLIAAELDIHDNDHAEPAQATPWRRYTVWAAGGVGALVVAGILVAGRLRRTSGRAA